MQPHRDSNLGKAAYSLSAAVNIGLITIAMSGNRDWAMSAARLHRAILYRNYPVARVERRDERNGKTTDYRTVHPGSVTAKIWIANFDLTNCFLMAGVEGLEPPTPGFGDRCSTS